MEFHLIYAVVLTIRMWLSKGQDEPIDLICKKDNIFYAFTVATAVIDL